MGRVMESENRLRNEREREREQQQKAIKMILFFSQIESCSDGREKWGGSWNLTRRNISVSILLIHSIHQKRKHFSFFNLAIQGKWGERERRRGKTFHRSGRMLQFKSVFSRISLWQANWQKGGGTVRGPNWSPQGHTLLISLKSGQRALKMNTSINSFYRSIWNNNCTESGSSSSSSSVAILWQDKYLLTKCAKHQRGRERKPGNWVPGCVCVVVTLCITQGNAPPPVTHKISFDQRGFSGRKPQRLSIYTIVNLDLD